MISDAPDVFSKEQMRALRLIHENWARRISVSLTSYLRGSVEVDLADIDQGIYVSLAQQLGVSGIFYVIGLGSLPGRFMLHMPNDLAMKIVDRIMGGPGLNIESSRDLTELEVDLLTQVVERLITDLRESWSGTILLNPRIDDTALNLMLVPIALPADAIVTVTFEVRVRGLASSMTMGLPYPVLKPIAARLNPYNTWVKSDSIKTEDAEKTTPATPAGTGDCDIARYHHSGKHQPIGGRSGIGPGGRHHQALHTGQRTVSGAGEW